MGKSCSRLIIFTIAGGRLQRRAGCCGLGKPLTGFRSSSAARRGEIGASGTDAYSLLSKIGRDCVGALQFVPHGDVAEYETAPITGEVIGNKQIEDLLKTLGQAPLGLDKDQEFRISVAGAQEKTALLFYDRKWWKPHGTTPTTHILKTQIGTLPNGIDLSNSVENEYYCLRVMAAFGLPVNAAKIKVFGKTKVLVVERFDRKWISRGTSPFDAKRIPVSA